MTIIVLRRRFASLKFRRIASFHETHTCPAAMTVEQQAASSQVSTGQPATERGWFQPLVRTTTYLGIVSGSLAALAVFKDDLTKLFGLSQTTTTIVVVVIGILILSVD